MLKALAVGAVVLRVVLAWSSALDHRVELVTPVTDSAAYREGVFQFMQGHDPYAGGVLHVGPLNLIPSLFGGPFGHLFPLDGTLWAVLGDIVAAFALGKIIGRTKSSVSGSTATCLYLLNPLSILSTGAKSSVAILNAAVLVALASAQSGSVALAALAFAFAVYQSVYAALLISPLAILLSQRTRGFVFVLWSSVCYALLLWLSSTMTGSWNFIDETIGFVLRVPDLTPNVGLFWYFYTDLFPLFKPFFLWLFQLHILLYWLPLTVALWKEPLLLAAMLSGIAAIFQPYTSFGDSSVYLGILLAYLHLASRMRFRFISAYLLLFGAMLCPLFWHLWIVAGAGNANFFYVATVIYSAGHILLLSDVLYAHMLDTAVKQDPALSTKQLKMI